MVRFARPTRSGRNRPAKNKVKDGTRLGNVSSPLETICETLPHCQSAERVIEFGDGNETRCQTSDFRKTKSETTKARRYVDILRVDWYSSQTYLGRRKKGARMKFSTKSLTLIQVLGHPACQSACCSGSPCSAGVQGSPGPGDNIFGPGDNIFDTSFCNKPGRWLSWQARQSRGRLSWRRSPQTESWRCRSSPLCLSSYTSSCGERMSF